MRSRSLMVAALIAAGLLALLLWLVRRDPPSATRTHAASPAASSQAESAPAAVGTRPELRVDPALAGDPRKDVQVLDATREHLEGFYQVPPWSRPVAEDTRYLTAEDSNVSSGKGFASGADGAWVVEVTVAPRIVRPGQPVEVTVTVAHERNNEQVPVSDQDVTMTVAVERFDRHAGVKITTGPPPERTDGFEPVASVAMQRHGPTWTGRFSPGQLAALAGPAIEARVVARVMVGGHPVKVDAPLNYASQPVFAVLAVGRERLGAGSLVVPIEVHAAEAGTVTLRAALFDASGQRAVATYDREHPVVAGHQIIEITFFGKVIHDAAIDGPYRVRRLRGLFVAKDLRRFEWRDEREGSTAAFLASDFSPRSWDGPEKDAALEAIDKQRARYEGLDPSQP